MKEHQDLDISDECIKIGHTYHFFLSRLININFNFIIIFHAYMFRIFVNTMFVNFKKRPQGRLVPLIGLPSVNKVCILYLLGQLEIIWRKDHWVACISTLFKWKQIRKKPAPKSFVGFKNDLVKIVND